MKLLKLCNTSSSKHIHSQSVATGTALNTGCASAQMVGKPLCIPKFLLSKLLAAPDKRQATGAWPSF